MVLKVILSASDSFLLFGRTKKLFQFEYKYEYRGSLHPRCTWKHFLFPLDVPFLWSCFTFMWLNRKIWFSSPQYVSPFVPVCQPVMSSCHFHQLFSSLSGLLFTFHPLKLSVLALAYSVIFSLKILMYTGTSLVSSFYHAKKKKEEAINNFRKDDYKYVILYSCKCNGFLIIKWGDCASGGRSLFCTQKVACSNPNSICFGYCVLGQDTSSALPTGSGQRTRRRQGSAASLPSVCLKEAVATT